MPQQVNQHVLELGDQWQQPASLSAERGET